MKKIFVINFGATSSKIAYFEDDQCRYKENLTHPAELLRQCETIWDQMDIRKKAIDDFMSSHGIKVSELDAIVSRGGHTEPIEGGVYRVTQKMLDQSRSMKFGNHPTDLGLQLAGIYAKEGPTAYTVDSSCTDEFEPLARYSGLKEIERVSRFQILNQRAVARKYAESINKSYEELNLITCMLGGGITCAAHKKGKAIDADYGLEGDGPFSTDRANGLPSGALVDMCFSGEYTYKEMKRKIKGLGGLMSYVGDTDVKAIEDRAEKGDKICKEALQAMAYQTAKDIAGLAAVLEGKVDAILLTGGIANSDFIVNEITKRVQFIAPIAVYPGEYEMDSLGINVYKALMGQVEVKELV